ncbi:MAG: CDP-diacylglycerol--serine O-phosphatidyltransferase [Gammaproteobacteria bacterium]|nr:CDP-diacylglycerol--serine O-phosphatidyltransferase [Gammaproteobacteria bacterium]
MHEPGKLRRRGIYLLPNLLTSAALFSGFYAIVAAIHGRFEAAAIAIFISMVLDSLDGRIARLTNTQSDFGKEYDSLADMISFGVAPALVVYQLSLSHLRKLGWMVAFIYMACAALRLARFNTQAATFDKAYFQGLPSPSAAALLAGMTWVIFDYQSSGYQINGRLLDFTILAITLSAGLLMVSTFRYHSFKDMDLKRRIPFVRILAMVLILAFVAVDPAQMLFVLALGYAASGPLLTFAERRKRRRRAVLRLKKMRQNHPPDKS